MLETLVDQLLPWFADWGLWIVLVATFIESSIIVASFFPGESVLLLSGFFASPHALEGGPLVPLEAVIAVAFLGAFLGDLVGYGIGRRWGKSIVDRFGKFVFLNHDRLHVLEEYFRAYGGRAVLFGRFAPFLRSVRSLVAGTAGMEFRSFALPAFIGAAAWSALVVTVGFALGESYRVADKYLGAGGIVVLALLVIGFGFTWRSVRRRVQREIAAPSLEGTSPSRDE